MEVVDNVILMLELLLFARIHGGYLFLWKDQVILKIKWFKTSSPVYAFGACVSNIGSSFIYMSPLCLSFKYTVCGLFCWEDWV
jgi:hypothetical protein